MSTHPIPGNRSSRFARLGGRDAVVRLVDAFYAAMDALPEAATIRTMHDADLTQTKHVLVKYLTEWLGGGRSQSLEHGAPILRRRHQRFAIDGDASGAWMLCMRKALGEVCRDEGLRLELDAAFGKVANFMRNTEAPPRTPTIERDAS